MSLKRVAKSTVKVTLIGGSLTFLAAVALLIIIDRDEWPEERELDDLYDDEPKALRDHHDGSRKRRGRHLASALDNSDRGQRIPPGDVWRGMEHM